MTKKHDADNNKPILYKDHPRPRTRREFLASGLIGATSLAFGPDLFNVFKLSPSEVLAAEGQCVHDKICNNLPYMCFDAAGGMNIPGGNVIVGFGSGEDQEDFGSTISLSDFIKMGLPSNMHPSLSGMIDDTYGIKFHSTSGLLEGMNSVLEPEIMGDTDLRNSIEGVFICSILSDDTGNNPINTAHMARKAGATGDLVQILGNRNTNTGGNSTAPQDQIDLMYKPSTIRRFADSESLISIGDKMMGQEYLNASDPTLGARRLKAFMEKARKIGVSKFRDIAQIQQDQSSSQNRVGETLKQTKAVFDKYSPADLNPSKNSSDLSVLNPIFGQEQADGSYQIGRSEEQVATIANLITKRIAGSGTVTLGGYDYHNGTSSTGNIRDYQMGRYIGQSIKLAAARGQNLFIHLLTDGGCVGDTGGAVDNSPEGKGRVIWASDSGTRSGALLLAYKHGHTRIDGTETSNMLLSNRKRQVGHYIQGGGVAKGANSVSNSPDQLWKAIILNYFACMTNSTDDDEVVRVAGEAFEEKFGDLPSGWKSLIRFKSLIV